jgi:hypothetical protein
MTLQSIICLCEQADSSKKLITVANSFSKAIFETLIVAQ